MAELSDSGSERASSHLAEVAPLWRGLRQKWVLPVEQMAATPSLRGLELHLTRFAARRCDMPGPDGASTLLAAMNAPLLLVRVLGARILHYDLAYSISFYTVAAGLLWAWVVQNLECWHEQRSIYTFRWLPLRRAWDVIAVAAGALLGVKAFEISTRVGPFPHRPAYFCYSSDIWLQWVPMQVATFLYAGWCVALVGLFGRDLVRTVPRKSASPRSIRPIS